MEKFIILPDITCDLNQDIRDTFGVKDYVKGYIHFSDGRDFQTSLHWDTISREEFYKALSNRRLKISTAPLSPDEYYEIFKAYVKDGYKILSMTLSSKISSTHGVSCVAAERVKEEYPDATIYCFDSYRMSGALGLLVMHAFALQNEGRSFEEIIAWLEENKLRVHQMGPIDDLMFVARRGRISTGKAIMGSFAGVKPMGDCNDEGYVTVLAKVKGIKKAFETTVAYVKACATDIENQMILVMHSDREAYAMTLKEELEKQLHPKHVYVSDVFCGCGTNIGPGMVGVYFLGEKVSEGMATEKDIMNSILGN